MNGLNTSMNSRRQTIPLIGTRSPRNPICLAFRIVSPPPPSLRPIVCHRYPVCSDRLQKCIIYILVYTPSTTFDHIITNRTLFFSISTMASHAYYPLGVEIPNYVPNQWSPLLLCSIFAVACIVALTIARMIATNLNPRITAFELSKVFWFSICMVSSSFVFNVKSSRKDQAAPSTSSSKATMPSISRLLQAPTTFLHSFGRSTPCLIPAISHQTPL